MMCDQPGGELVLDTRCRRWRSISAALTLPTAQLSICQQAAGDEVETDRDARVEGLKIDPAMTAYSRVQALDKPQLRQERKCNERPAPSRTRGQVTTAATLSRSRAVPDKPRWGRAGHGERALSGRHGWGRWWHDEDDMQLPARNPGTYLPRVGISPSAEEGSVAACAWKMIAASDSSCDLRAASWRRACRHRADWLSIPAAAVACRLGQREASTTICQMEAGRLLAVRVSWRPPFPGVIQIRRVMTCPQTLACPSHGALPWCEFFRGQIGLPCVIDRRAWASAKFVLEHSGEQQGREDH